MNLKIYAVRLVHIRSPESFVRKSSSGMGLYLSSLCKLRRGFYQTYLGLVSNRTSQITSAYRQMRVLGVILNTFKMRGFCCNWGGFGHAN
jgi:hypothetical protein